MYITYVYYSWCGITAEESVVIRMTQSVVTKSQMTYIVDNG